MAEPENLRLLDAGFRYRGADIPALAGVDLRVRRGEMVAALGPQGSGTSTLCRLAAGLLEDRGDPSGEIVRPDDAGGTVPSAMLGEDPEAQLTGMTSFAEDEVRLPGRLHARERPGARDAESALDALGVARLAGRRLDTLSGGERQLVALAGLMTLDPRLLVLDQPTLSLDSTARQHLLRALRRYCTDGGSVLLAGHQHDELSAACDRVVLLREGRIAQDLPRDHVADERLAAHGVWSTVPPHPDPAAQAAPSATSATSATSASPADAAADRSDPGRAPILRVRGLGVERGGATILDGVDLDLEAGRVLAVLGANGAGKSTLLRGLAGLLGGDARIRGDIVVRSGGAEVALDGLPPYRRAAHLGWVGQDPSAQLSAPSAQAELEKAVPLPPHRRRERARLRAERAEDVDAVLELTGLADRAETHPYDLGPAQRKDLVIASALLLRSEVLLLDEPTLGRDLAGMERLGRTIRGFTDSGGAVVVTTHDHRWAARVSHETLRLEHGGTRR